MINGIELVVDYHLQKMRKLKGYYTFRLQRDRQGPNELAQIGLCASTLLPAIKSAVRPVSASLRA